MRVDLGHGDCKENLQKYCLSWNSRGSIKSATVCSDAIRCKVAHPTKFRKIQFRFIAVFHGSNTGRSGH